MTEALTMQSLESAVNYIVQWYCTRYSYLDRQELLGEAQIVTLQAVRGHKSAKVTVKTWVCACLWHHFSAMTRRANWRRRMSKGGAVLPETGVETSFDLGSLMKEVSEEAATAMTVALGLDMKKTELRKTLRQEFGWEWSEINRVFAEIREALG